MFGNNECAICINWATLEDLNRKLCQMIEMSEVTLYTQVQIRETLQRG